MASSSTENQNDFRGPFRATLRHQNLLLTGGALLRGKYPRLYQDSAKVCGISFHDGGAKFSLIKATKSPQITKDVIKDDLATYSVVDQVSQADCLWIGVFDGHGSVAGKEADLLSTLAREKCLQKFVGSFKTDMESDKIIGILQDSFSAAHEDIKNLKLKQYNTGRSSMEGSIPNSERSNTPKLQRISDFVGGTTATCAVIHSIEQDGSCEAVVGNVGDSRAIIFTRSGEILGCSKDHNLDNDSERQRVEERGKLKLQSGYNEGKLRVHGELLLTRALGHGFESQSDEDVTKPVGDFFSVNISSALQAHEEVFLMIATDGIWGFMKQAEVVNKVIERTEGEKDLSKVIKTLVDEITGDDAPRDDIAATIISFRRAGMSAAAECASCIVS